MDDDRDKDQERVSEGADMREGMGHEKLRVYQRSLDHAAWMHSTLQGIGRHAAVLDHWDRAAESIVENIANGNSRRSRADRNRYFDVAIGSGLECAACLDICRVRNMLDHDHVIEGKGMLRPIVSMTIGLREARSAYITQYRCLDRCLDRRRASSLSRSSPLSSSDLCGRCSEGNERTYGRRQNAARIRKAC